MIALTPPPRSGCHSHRRCGERALRNVLGNLLTAHETHHERCADPVVVEVVATQVRNRGNHACLHNRDAGDIGRYCHRKRGHAADVGHETLRRGKTHVVIDVQGYLS